MSLTSFMFPVSLKKIPPLQHSPILPDGNYPRGQLTLMLHLRELTAFLDFGVKYPASANVLHDSPPGCDAVWKDHGTFSGWNPAGQSR